MVGCVVLEETSLQLSVLHFRRERGMECADEQGNQIPRRPRDAEVFGAGQESGVSAKTRVAAKLGGPGQGHEVENLVLTRGCEQCGPSS